MSNYFVTVLACLALTAEASSQLEALKDSWAAESVALPANREEWVVWKDTSQEVFAGQVARAKAMCPTLVVEMIQPETPRTDRVVVAIGGSGETLHSIRRTQGDFFVALGYKVLMVENPPDDIARICLERETSWLAYGTAALVEEVKRFRGEADVIWSGFSLGTELMMSAGGICARKGDLFIYNDFLCRSKERLLVMDTEPNGLRNVTPGYFVARDFPERMLALSDHPLLFTEGGLDRDFRIVKSIFPKNVTVYHQPRFANADRFQGDALPRHLSLPDYFHLCNVDPSNHFYKQALVRHWLAEVAVR